MVRKAAFISRLRSMAMVGTAFLFPLAASAGSWSTCQTITAVSNYIAYSNTVYVVLSPGIPGCNNDAVGSVMFRDGQMNVTADSLKTYLATALTAQATGKRVMIFYNESAPTCYSNVIAVGGTMAQCP